MRREGDINWTRGLAGLALACATAWSAAAAPAPVAPTPPMGWNSWDAYGFTVDEGQFKANAQEVARLKRYGWRYVVIDEGWYMRNPFGDKLETRGYQMDGHGLLIPDSKRFPSAADGRGFKALADWARLKLSYLKFFATHDNQAAVNLNWGGNGL